MSDGCRCTILVTAADGTVIVQVTLAKHEIWFGRTRDRRNDVVIPGPSIAKRQAKLVRHREQWWLVELKATSGVYVNGVRVRQPVTVTDRDHIGMGNYVVTLVVLSPP